MTRLFSPVSALLGIVVLAAPPALAQDALAKKVTVDVNAASPVSVFKAVGTASGAGFTVTVDPAVTRTVDITVRNVSVKTALNAICESIGCQWTLTGNDLVVKPLTSFMVGVVQHDTRAVAVDKEKATARGQVVLGALKKKLPPDMRFENAPLSEVSKRLSEALGMNVELSCRDASVQTLTMDFSNLTLQSALQAIGARETGPRAAWRVTIAPGPGDTQTPTIAVMVGPRPTKKK